LSELAFKLMFLAFVVIGASMGLGPVIDFSDSMIFAMSLANIVGLYFLMPVVKRELNMLSDFLNTCMNALPGLACRKAPKAAPPMINIS